MNFLIKSNRGYDQVSDRSCLLMYRAVFLTEEINQSVADTFMCEIMYLNNESTREPIDLYINSPGGEINAGLRMYDVIQGSEAPIRTYCIGQAYSMAAILLACGRHERYITPNGEVMIHEPRLLGSVGGTTSSIKSMSDSMQKTKKKLDTILADCTGKTIREVAKATGYDHYFSAEESIAFGLCDEIVTNIAALRYHNQ